MLTNDFTKKALANRRFSRDMKKLGYEEISCSAGIGSLWELDRGYRYNHRIVDCKIAPSGKSIWVKAKKV